MRGVKAIRVNADLAFSLINGFLLVLIILSMLLPFVHIVAKSLSAEHFVVANEVAFIPKGIHFGAYRFVLGNPTFGTSFLNTLLVTVTGTLVSTLLTSVTGFAVARPEFKFGRFLMLLFVITMFFSGGIIPNYLLVRNLGLLNTRLSLILPIAISAWQLILIRSFMLAVPESLFESARMDGAGYARIAFQIYLPLAKASVATIAMFYAVGYWNDFFSALIYITDRSLYPLQLYLREIVTDQTRIAATDIDALMQTSPESVKGATIVAATLPILVVYPWVQRYFVRGIMIGAVKG